MLRKPRLCAQCLESARLPPHVAFVSRVEAPRKCRIAVELTLEIALHSSRPVGLPAQENICFDTVFRAANRAGATIARCHDDTAILRCPERAVPGAIVHGRAGVSRSGLVNNTAGREDGECHCKARDPRDIAQRSFDPSHNPIPGTHLPPPISSSCTVERVTCAPAAQAKSNIVDFLRLCGPFL